MSGAQRQLALLLAAGFALILFAITVANVGSELSDLAAARVAETTAHVWIWEATSIFALITEMPAIWWLVRRVRPPRFSWPMVALVAVTASVPLSLWHIGVMVGMRKLIYAAVGDEYRFFNAIGNRLLYEYRKDFATYLQFTGLAAIAQWLIDRAAPTTAPAAAARTLVVGDGAVTHQVPVDEIDHVTAAGNYVEIAWGPRALLHRATLSGVAAELGPGFVQIHRSRLVRRIAIRRIETDRSGDFTVVLESGASLKGSRRYRESVQG